MSSISSPERYTLQLPADPDAAVTVYDAGDMVVWSGAGGGAIDLPRGLYTVRVDINQQIAERTVRLVHATDLSWLAPQRYTAAPLLGAASSHEYYSYTSEGLSRNETRPPLVGEAPPDAELFIFLRSVDMEHARHLSRPLGQGLELRDATGMVVSRLDVTECVVNTTQGWLAFSTQAPHGYYRLVDLGDHPRELALHLFPHWQTTLFVLWTDRPVLEGAGIFVQRPIDGFRPAGEVEQAADLALDVLARGAGRMPRRALDILWCSKFENPMLGLIGAYTELQHLRSLSEEGRQVVQREVRHLLDIVIGNLGELMPESPDVQALKVFAAEVCGGPVPSRPFLQPPMFRAGFDAVVRAATERPELVPSSGIVDNIATVLFTDSVWTTWRPLKATPARWSAQPERSMRAPRSMRGAAVRIDGETPRAQAEEIEFCEPFEPNWVQSGFLTALQTEKARLQRKEGRRGKLRVEVAKLATQLHITPSAIEEAVAAMDVLGAEEVRVVLENGWDSLASSIDPEGPRRFSRFIEADSKGKPSGT